MTAGSEGGGPVEIASFVAELPEHSHQASPPGVERSGAHPLDIYGHCEWWHAAHGYSCEADSARAGARELEAEVIRLEGDLGQANLLWREWREAALDRFAETADANIRASAARAEVERLQSRWDDLSVTMPLAETVRAERAEARVERMRPYAELGVKAFEQDWRERVERAEAKIESVEAAERRMRDVARLYPDNADFWIGAANEIRYALTGEQVGP